jgi:hypothetical protein
MLTVVDDARVRADGGMLRRLSRSMRCSRRSRGFSGMPRSVVLGEAASYWREPDEVWLAKLRAYAATLPRPQGEIREN